MKIQGYRLWHEGRVRRNQAGLCAVCEVRLSDGATYKEGDYLYCREHPAFLKDPLRKPISDLEVFVWLTKEDA
jgi:hypothetical protein